MSNELMMSMLTSLLVLVGLGQLVFLKSQRRQNQLNLLQEYRSRWEECSKNLAIIIFIGRNDNEYYQLADRKLVSELSDLVKNNDECGPTIWALESINHVCNNLSDICIKILQGQLEIQDVYPLFGSNLLRHSRPLRVLLDVNSVYARYQLQSKTKYTSKHTSIRKELQDWLIYHDGVRRRCLILIDMLWAEGTRLGDLSPDDIRCAADAKLETGSLSRKRLISEFKRVNSIPRPFLAFKLTHHLKHSEYKKHRWQVGVDEAKLEKRNKIWLNMLLREFDRD